MTPFQKVTKYIAIALATLLIVTIFGGIITGLSSISLLFSKKDTEPVGEMKTYQIDNEITSISVDLGGAELRIQTADKFSLQSNHKYLSVQSENGNLRISETKKLFSPSRKELTVILNIPKDAVLENATIETGAGKLNIDVLSCRVLNLSLGAGKADINNLTATSSAEIDGGAGKLEINGGKLCNLDLDMGVGALKLKSRIEGKSSLDYGVGKTDLILIGSREDYKIKLDKGIGKAELLGEEMSDDSVYGSGQNEIEIDGGVGEINIDFSDK